jgi:hypothetical protein
MAWQLQEPHFAWLLQTDAKIHDAREEMQVPNELRVRWKG